MSKHEKPLGEQIEFIQQAMKKAGVWSNDVPEWVHSYSSGVIPNIWEWLQFIYLPMRTNEAIHKPHYLAPILSRYMNESPEYNYILQLVIELDSISSTIK